MYPPFSLAPERTLPPGSAANLPTPSSTESHHPALQHPLHSPPRLWNELSSQNWATSLLRFRLSVAPTALRIKATLLTRSRTQGFKELRASPTSCTWPPGHVPVLWVSGTRPPFISLRPQALRTCCSLCGGRRGGCFSCFSSPATPQASYPNRPTVFGILSRDTVSLWCCHPCPSAASFAKGSSRREGQPHLV